jgi:NAD(P) transhydrogenase subunit beta
MNDLTYYIISGVLIIGVLIGISFMSKVKSSVKGNALSAVCTAAAIIVTLYRFQIVSDVGIGICMIIGLVVGLVAAWRVKMISMPQTVAILNGFGGGASAIVGFLALSDTSDMFARTTSVLAVAVGLTTLTGSLVAAGKLQRLLSQKPVILRNHSLLTNGMLMLTLGTIIAAAFSLNSALLVAAVLCAVAASIFGILFSIRVGGADMPITISLLNSLSGVAGSIAGMAISDPLLVAIGGVVGSSGLLLTQIMCRAMNRSLADILFGRTSTVSMPQGDALVKPMVNTTEQKPEKAAVPADEILKAAKRVILVPGYGMALAQAQSLVKQLADKLETEGKEVMFAIHPVAGRMPGHMNVLLAEVGVDYDRLLEMDEVNSLFAGCDAAVVVGANDVLNPAANSAAGTPIYGMPILKVEDSAHIIVCNFDLQPGYAGVPNPIYERDNTTLLLGDAKETLKALLAKL